MAQIKIRWGIDYKEFKEVSRFIKISETAFTNLRELYEEMVEIIRQYIDHLFNVGGEPKWQALSKLYLESDRKKESKFPISVLKLTGKLQRAATQKGAYGNICEIMDWGFTWGVSVDDIPYAKIQDVGGTIQPHEIFGVNKPLTWKDAQGKRRFAWSVMHPGAVIPKREYMKLSKETNTTLGKVAHRFALNTLVKAINPRASI